MNKQQHQFLEDLYGILEDMDAPLPILDNLMALYEGDEELPHTSILTSETYRWSKQPRYLLFRPFMDSLEEE